MIANEISEAAELLPQVADVFGREIYRAPAPSACPFCGAADEMVICRTRDADVEYCAVFEAECFCGAKGAPGASEIEACEKWNRRAA